MVASNILVGKKKTTANHHLDAFYEVATAKLHVEPPNQPCLCIIDTSQVVRPRPPGGGRAVGRGWHRFPLSTSTPLMSLMPPPSSRACLLNRGCRSLVQVWPGFRVQQFTERPGTRLQASNHRSQFNTRTGAALTGQNSPSSTSGLQASKARLWFQNCTVKNLTACPRIIKT